MKIFQSKLSWILLLVTIATAVLIYFCPSDYPNFGSIEKPFSHSCGFLNGGFGEVADCVDAHLSVANQIVGIFDFGPGMLFLLLLFCAIFWSDKKPIIIKTYKLKVFFKHLSERYKTKIRTTIESRFRYYLTLFSHI
jgi:hypothetical protein